MAKIRRILALVLVMAMTFSMLPVFASAEEVVSEVAAVETVEAPVAEAPAAEAPAEAPAAEVPVVEDVAEIPAEIPADVPVVEAIETAATETVAVLQDEVSAEDLAAIEAGTVFKVVDPDGGVTYASTPVAAIKTASGWSKSGGTVIMLADYVGLGTETSAQSAPWIAWYGNPTYTTTDEDGLTVNGFWFDLGGNTLAMRRGGPLLGAAISATASKGSLQPWVNIRNGHIIHLNLLSDKKAGRGSSVNGSIHFGTTSTAPASSSTLISTHVNLKDVDLVTIDYSDGTDKVMKGYASSCWNNEVKLYNSKILSHNTYGVHFYKSSSNSTDATIQATIKAAGSKNTLELHDGSVVGSYKLDTVAVFYTANKAALNAGIDHSVTVTADETSMFIGTKVFSQTDQSTFDEAVRYNVNLTLPSGHVGTSSFEYAVPSKSSYPASTCSGEAARIDRGTAKTYTAMRYCTAGSEAVQHVPAKDPTFIAEGCIEHWVCAECGTYYSDSTAETIISAADVAIPVRATTDTEGLETDEQFAALGAVAITIAPDGTKIAYTGATAINDAYQYAAHNWTEAGGVVRMVCDYTYVNGTNSDYNPAYINGNASSPSTDKSSGYSLPIPEGKADLFAGLDLTGFWLDLGGHTLTLRTGMSVFYTRTNNINIRNGRIIYQDTAKATASYAPLKFAHTVNGGPGYSGSEVYWPVATFDDLTLIRAPYYEGKEIATASPKGGSFFWISALQSTINLIDSALINDDGNATIAYDKAMSETANAAVLAAPYYHEINIRGDVILGRTSEGSIISASALCDLNEVGDASIKQGIHLNVAENANVTYLGTSIATIADSDLAAASTMPSGLVASATPYSYTMPDMNTAAITSSAAGVADMAEAGSYAKLEKQSDVASRATFTPNGGEESAVTSLSAAFLAWEQNGYSGKITLKEDLTAANAEIVTAIAGAAGTFYRPYSSGATATVSVNAMCTVTADANGKDLTFDLGGNTLELDSTFITLDAELTGFDLTIQNGTVTSDYTYPLLALKGADNNLKLDNVNLSNTHETANFSYLISDSRYDNSYSVVTDSVLSSAHGAAIAVATIGANADDATLLYYVKDSNLSGVKTDYSPATVASYTAISGSVYRPASNFVLVNTTVEGEKATNYTNGKSYVEVATAAESDAAATVTFGDIASISCASANDAMKAAELFGRNASAAAKVTLEKDTVIAESIAMGLSGVETAFTLDLNGKALDGDGLIDANGGEGTKVTMTVVGDLANDDEKAYFFANTEKLDYASGNSYVIEKGRYFTTYSLNLEDNVTINLYTDGANGMPDAVTYIQDGSFYRAVRGEKSEWMVKTLAAKDMAKKINAYAVKTEGNVTYLDFGKNISVNGYVSTDPGANETNEEIKTALNATLQSMSIYGQYAEKFFKNDYSEIENVPEVDTSNLNDIERNVSEGIGNRLENNELTEGYWGTSAVLQDQISIKMYFYGEKFDGAYAKVQYGAGDFEEISLDGENGGFKYVKAAVAAKDFDTAITVALYKNDAVNGETLIGTVTDSVSSYTSRIADTDNAYKLAQALRAYGADAKRYDAAKNAN